MNFSIENCISLRFSAKEEIECPGYQSHDEYRTANEIEIETLPSNKRAQQQRRLNEKKFTMFNYYRLEKRQYE